MPKTIYALLQGAIKKKKKKDKGCMLICLSRWLMDLKLYAYWLAHLAVPYGVQQNNCKTSSDIIIKVPCDLCCKQELQACSC